MEGRVVDSDEHEGARFRGVIGGGVVEDVLRVSDVIWSGWLPKEDSLDDTGEDDGVEE